ncbi:MAG: alpha/beta fold hydrolase [Anaerolineae bacterium]|nr:alpha/beta fold hydrolase [Anaerolineae bacterium]
MVTFRTLYPFTSHTFDLDGVRMHYLDEGPQDAPPVVMVHGNPTWSFYYRTLIPELSKTHRVIVPDHVGCGFSDKPQDYPYTLEQHIQNLERLLLSLGLQKMTLALHDWGGGIGMGFATRHPELVTRFVVFNTSAFYAPAVPFVLKLARSRGLGELIVRGLNLFSLSALVMGTSQRRRFTPEVRAGYLAPYDSWRNRIAVYRFVQDIPLSTQHPTRATVDAIDARLHLFSHHPMLILWGADDFVFTTKTFLAGWRTRFPSAEVHILENAGHYVVEDAHERILPLMEKFLREFPND